MIPKITDDPSKAAGKWFVQLSSDNSREADYQAWQAWREANPENEKAWQKIEQLTSQLKSFSSEVGIAGTLRRLYDKPHSEGRRRILKQMAIVMAISSTGYLTYKKQPWQELTADYSTGTGEFREIALTDGTRLFMNTSTAVDIDYDDTHRILTLLKGEVLIETAHEQTPVYRPFILKTQHGAVTALGTRFSVRDQDQFSSLSVFEGAVRVAPKNNQDAPVTINAGESIKFTTTNSLQKGAADAASASWSQGFLIVDQLPLGEFIAELSRYRRGVLQCDSRVAQLLVSGSFPTDTDSALNILAHKFPIQIQTFTRYWTKVGPA